MNGCWIWKGAKTSTGYPVLKFSGKTLRAHRAAYQAFVGNIPEDLELDHTCKTITCVNPDHLEPIPHLENLKRGTSLTHHAAAKYRRAITHCPAGHPYKGDNLYVSPAGKRYCRLCRHAISRRRLERKKRNR
jgi:hypothetical protein